MNFISKTKIAEMPSIESVNPMDRFVVSKQLDNNTLSSATIEVSNLIQHLDNYLGALSSFSPAGNFYFNTVQTSKLHVETNLSNDQTVPSIEYAKSGLMALVTGLSQLIYGTGKDHKQYIPSHVGQIIMGYEEVDSIDKVKAIYGGEWQQLRGRMLIGAGSPGSSGNRGNYGRMDAGYSIPNKKYGGQQDVVLDSLPAHSHVFYGMQFYEFPGHEFSFPLSSNASEGGKSYECNVQARHGSSVKRNHPQRYLNENAEAVGVEYDTDREKEFKFKAHGMIKENVSKVSAHTNIPNIRTAYIWERIA